MTDVIIPKFLSCLKCGRSFEQHRYFFEDYKERICRYCKQGLEPDDTRDFYLSTDADIEKRIKKFEKEQEEQSRTVDAIIETKIEQSNDILSKALAEKKSKRKTSAMVIDDCLIKAADVEAKIKLKKGRKRI